MAMAPATLVPHTCDLAEPTQVDWVSPVLGTAPRLPEQVDGWWLEGCLGQGSTATVHLARKGRKLAVVKVMRVNASSHSGAAIRHEARWLRKHGVAGCPEVVARGELADGRPWFVMTMAPGSSFSTWWARCHPLPVKAVVQAVAQAARIAGAAHRKGWIHRDLKPSNLAIGPDGRVTVLDWGLVRPIQRDGQTQLAIAGTPGFMPPELLRGIVPAYTPDVDTFALGCTLAVLLSRSPVAVGALRPSLVRRILAEAGLTGIAASTLHHIICRAISISPAERWEDGDTLAAELEDWVSLMADAATEAPAPHATLARRSRTAS